MADDEQKTLKDLSEVDESFNTGIFFQEELCSIDEKQQNFVDMSNGQRLRLSMMFVPKHMDFSEMIKPENCIFLKYNETVESFMMNDILGNFGLTACVELFNDGGCYDTVLQRHNCYHFVVTISILGDGDDSVKLEPYVFDIVNVEPLPPKSSHERRMKLNLVDLITSVAKQHSIASVIKCYPNIVNSSSYKEVFKCILGYIKKYFKSNYLFKVDFKKTARFMNESTDFSSLVNNSFKRISRSASIFEAMKILMNDAATAIQAPEEFKRDFSYVADVSLPFFFRDEYPDAHNVYLKVWDSNNPDIKNAKNAEGKNTRDDYQLVTSSGENIIYRDIMFRDMYMPFGLAFSKYTEMVYEIINPHTDEKGNLLPDEKYDSINGYTKYHVNKLIQLPMNFEYVTKKWKNYIIMSSGSNNNSSVLIYFNWMYYWFVQIMLNGMNNKIVSNVTPDFFLRMKNNKIPTYGKKAYDEANAVVVHAITEDPVAEAMRAIGKNVASFVRLNEQYSFEIEGNIFRRPNEIIKFNKDSNVSIEDNTQTIVTTDLAGNSTILLYVIGVQHVFKGGTYTNIIHSNKIYEKIESDH